PRHGRGRQGRGEGPHGPRDGNGPAQGLQGRDRAGLVHPERHRHGERQDRAVGRVGARGGQEPVPVVPLRRRQGRRQGGHHLDRQPRRQAQRRSDDRRMRPKRIAAAALAAGILSAGLALAQDKDSTSRQIERYREALADGNPAELWEARGESLWKEKRGPKAASLERCDLGLGPGVVKGAYTVFPKYFADTGKVEDLESRLVTCMVALQGFTPEQAKKDPFGGPGKKVPMDALVAYIASESRGMPMHVSIANPKEREAYELGRQIFFYRGGPHDFACASCH